MIYKFKYLNPLHLYSNLHNLYIAGICVPVTTEFKIKIHINDLSHNLKGISIMIKH